MLTPLQSLKAPACQLASGWQYLNQYVSYLLMKGVGDIGNVLERNFCCYPYSEQQGAEAGQPRGHFTARALDQIILVIFFSQKK